LRPVRALSLWLLCLSLAACRSDALTAEDITSSDLGPTGDLGPGPSPRPTAWPACLLGDWEVTDISYGVTGARIRFVDTTQFQVWDPGLSSAAPPTGRGEYHLPTVPEDLGNSETQLAIDWSMGLDCSYTAVYDVTVETGCRALRLNAVTDNCTGARRHLAAYTYLEAR
jgi:hypothetical protein